MRLRHAVGWVLLISPVVGVLVTMMVVGGRDAVLGVGLGVALAGVVLLGSWLAMSD